MPSGHRQARRKLACLLLLGSKDGRRNVNQAHARPRTKFCAACSSIAPVAKLLLAGGIGLWIGLCAAVGAAGIIAIAEPFPIIGLFVGFPLAAGAIAGAAPAGRAAMLSIPMPVMIGLNVARVFGGLFLVLEAQGRLAGPFPFFAAWG